MVLPGDTLTLEVTLTKFRGPVGFGSAVATVDGKRAVTAEISFAVSDPEK
jgi:3-hydroxyacyl-[acyl-carrier-protein] dehydratase